MAGGTTTIELVVAVSEAGGLGSLAAGLLSPEQGRNYTHKMSTWLSSLYIQQ
ncbi:nitronate monooxygenase [Suttonella ornithocola]|uniref:Nitronate monooxygenase n=1 Tax=Suttonella ornithocola TaxID=279832 RepID=A0A380MNW7_9GAMM|nr:nitronate monooxygenase [Suttonella ornithocola]SUO93958.1 Nitronate monooxygenase [Suttonella ornithocola]